ncbi:MAG: beta-eliminating lyase-related protein [Acidimicrobiales bacterium]
MPTSRNSQPDVGGVPAPPTCSFASDNTAGASPEVLAALAAADGPAALAYGADRWTAAVTDAFAERCGQPVDVLLCWGGTGANVVGVAAGLESWEAVLCADTAHLVTDEGGAPARMTGALVLTEPNVDGKLVPEAIERARRLARQRAPPAGRRGVDQSGHRARHRLHARRDRRRRTARTATACGCTSTVPASPTPSPPHDSDLRAMVVDTGVDIVTWGATKNGGIYGEAVLVLDPSIAGRARFLRKQLGQLPSKMRYIAAQVLALLDDDRWITQAAHANAMAARLAGAVAGIDGVEVVRPPEANAVFARLPVDRIDALQDWSFFWDWDRSDGLVRWMTHAATTPDDVDRFAAGVAAIVGR